MFLSRGDRDLGVAFQTHPGRQAFISSGSKEPRSALEYIWKFIVHILLKPGLENWGITLLACEMSAIVP